MEGFEYNKVDELDYLRMAIQDAIMKYDDEMMEVIDWNFDDDSPDLPYPEYPFVLYKTFYEIEDEKTLQAERKK